MALKRFGVSIPEDLLEQFDEIVERKGYIGRSEAIRDAMRLFILNNELTLDDAVGFGSLNLVYEHKPRLMTALLKHQHSAIVDVVSTLHTHITQTHCFEILTLKGSLKGIRQMADKIGGLKGVEFMELFTFALPDMKNTTSHGHSH